MRRALIATVGTGTALYERTFWTNNQTEFELARWLGSHAAAVALQATLGVAVSLALAWVSYEFFEKRFLQLKRLYADKKLAS